MKKFNNKKFWNERYSTDMELGSGPGSRGENLRLKKNLIEKTLKEYGIKDVLDIGCGDIEIIKDLKIDNYIGYDISEIIIKRNQRIKPNWKFKYADILNLKKLPRADLVLCLDVLIHQGTERKFFNILKKCLDSIKKIGVLTGCKKDGWNVFFHMSLDKAIKQLKPQAKIEKLGEYRNTDILKVTFD
jgi:SAM-dependent methyltransferase